MFVMYHSQTPSPEMDQVRPAESDSKLWPELEVSKHMEPENEHEGRDLNSAWEVVNLKAEDSISLHSIQHCWPGFSPDTHLNMCAHRHRRRHASELHGYTVISLMRFRGIVLADLSSPPGKAESLKEKVSRDTVWKVTLAQQPCNKGRNINQSFPCSY